MKKVTPVVTFITLTTDCNKLFTAGQPNGNFNPPYNNPVVVYPPYPAPTQGQPLENIDQTSMNPPGVYPPLYPPKY